MRTLTPVNGEVGVPEYVPVMYANTPTCVTEVGAVSVKSSASRKLPVAVEPAVLTAAVAWLALLPANGPIPGSVTIAGVRPVLPLLKTCPCAAAASAETPAMVRSMRAGEAKGVDERCCMRFLSEAGVLMVWCVLR